MPRMTVKKPAKTKPAAFKKAVFLNRLIGVLGTGGLEATDSVGKKKSLEKGPVEKTGPLIAADGFENEFFHNKPAFLKTAWTSV